MTTWIPPFAIAALLLATPAAATPIVHELELSPFDKAATPEECFGSPGGSVLCWFAKDWDITGNFVPRDGESAFRLYVLENHALFTYTGAKALQWVELAFDGPAFGDVDPDESGFIPTTGLTVGDIFYDDPGLARLTSRDVQLSLETVFDGDPFAEVTMRYAVAPEPSMLALLALGTVAAYRRRRR